MILAAVTALSLGMSVAAFAQGLPPGLTQQLFVPYSYEGLQARYWASL